MLGGAGGPGGAEGPGGAASGADCRRQKRQEGLQLPENSSEELWSRLLFQLRLVGRGGGGIMGHLLICDLQVFSWTSVKSISRHPGLVFGGGQLVKDYKPP